MPWQLITVTETLEAGRLVFEINVPARSPADNSLNLLWYETTWSQPLVFLKTEKLMHHTLPILLICVNIIVCVCVIFFYSDA